MNSAELDAAIRDLDADLAKLRAQRATAPFALDRMLPFWALVFNLREIAQELKQLEFSAVAARLRPIRRYVACIVSACATVRREEGRIPAAARAARFEAA